MCHNALRGRVVGAHCPHDALTHQLYLSAVTKIYYLLNSVFRSSLLCIFLYFFISLLLFSHSGIILFISSDAQMYHYPEYDLLDYPSKMLLWQHGCDNTVTDPATIIYCAEVNYNFNLA